VSGREPGGLAVGLVLPGGGYGTRPVACTPQGDSKSRATGGYPPPRQPAGRRIPGPRTGLPRGRAGGVPVGEPRGGYGVALAVLLRVPPIGELLRYHTPPPPTGAQPMDIPPGDSGTAHPCPPGGYGYRYGPPGGTPMPIPHRLPVPAPQPLVAGDNIYRNPYPIPREGGRGGPTGRWGG
jgi:hypothetical protein